MEIVAAILSCILVLGGVYTSQRIWLSAGCTLFLVFGYVLTSNFWEMHLGPLPLTCDRVLLVLVVSLFAWRVYRGQILLQPLAVPDWIGIVFVGYLLLRLVTTTPPSGIATSVSPAWRLIASFLMPLALMAVLRNAQLDQRQWRLMLFGLVGLGLYLALTGIAEVKQQWWAVFPRFISNPALGTHFGRARGPALMSESLGLYLSVAFWAAWFLVPEVGRKSKLLLAGVGLLILAALYYTFTRSCWLGLLGGLCIIPLLHLPRSWRPLLLWGLASAACCGALVVGGNIVDMGRDDTDASAGHSVYQRASFAIVSWRMLLDAPIVGHGLGRFYDKKLAYLSDRSQQIELESIRPLDHHNTFLSILTETGMIGFILFLSLLAAWTYAAWQLYFAQEAPRWIQAQGLFTLAVIIAYVLNALFHDLTLSPPDEWIVAFVCGTTSGLYSRARFARTTVKPLLFTTWRSSLRTAT